MSSTRRVGCLLLAFVITAFVVALLPTSATAATRRGGGTDETGCKVIARNSTNDTMRRLDYSKGKGDTWDREPSLTMGTGGTGWESVDKDGRLCSNSVQYRFLNLNSPCNYADACVYTMKQSLTGKEAGSNPTSSCDVNNAYITCTKVEQKVENGHLCAVWRLCQKGFACSF